MPSSLQPVSTVMLRLTMATETGSLVCQCCGAPKVGHARDLLEQWLASRIDGFFGAFDGYIAPSVGRKLRELGLETVQDLAVYATDGHVISGVGPVSAQALAEALGMSFARSISHVADIACAHDGCDGLYRFAADFDIGAGQYATDIEPIGRCATCNRLPIFLGRADPIRS